MYWKKVSRNQLYHWVRKFLNKQFFNLSSSNNAHLEVGAEDEHNDLIWATNDLVSQIKIENVCYVTAKRANIAEHVSVIGNCMRQIRNFYQKRRVLCFKFYRRPIVFVRVSLCWRQTCRSWACTPNRNTSLVIKNCLIKLLYGQYSSLWRYYCYVYADTC